MILDVVPVLPPEIRPMVPLDGGRYAASDINDLYRRVINRNNRLKKLIELHTPEMIIKNEKRMLQEAVDALIDNGKHGKAVTGPSNRALKSLSEILRGKQGRFRQNLLGKRVDYSGRSVIVVGPSLKIYQCGLPREMALELFKPFVMKRLVETQKSSNIKEAKRKVEQVADEVWDALEVVIKEHPVLLNRAPTLHRLSIQAFEPVLVEGRAIKLHPLVCKAFNADFDGDQMPVHVPLSSEAQAEARFLMLSANNLLKPVDGKAIAVPSQDMVLGSYYLTLDPRDDEMGAGSVYRNYDEAIMAYASGELQLHAPIKVRVSKEINGEIQTKLIDATLGRLIFNNSIPQDLGYVDREVDPFGLEVNFVAGSKQLSQIVDRAIKVHGFTMAAEVLDHIKSMGYKYSTQASLSISVADMVIPQEKYAIVKAAEKQVDEILSHFKMGELSEEERYNCVIQIWEKATKDVVKQIQENFNKYNPIKMMSDSGARGSMTQMRQLAGMRGLMFSATGKTMEIPIKSNFREGLTILEYFVAARRARKSLSDTALKTADSGYLTRRLVDVSHEVIIREDDCGTRDYMVASDIKEGNEIVEKLEDRILGRYTVENIYDAEGNLIIGENEMILSKHVAAIKKAEIKEVKVRSVLRCKTKCGVCAHCYGMDLASSKQVNIGEAVGVIAAQSIGEPGTQLTMRTFHTGGVASANITQGLPRVEELFEARRPKKPAIACEASGVVSIVPDGRISIIHVKDEETGVEYKYDVPFGTTMVVHDGDYVTKGQALTEGYMAPADILKINGIEAVYDYIVREVQKVYRSQNVDVDDKHVEVITRQMTRKVKIEDAGDTDFIIGTVVDKEEFIIENEKIAARKEAGEIDLREATCSPILLGITKAASSTESFLSAASFQETTKALTEAAIKGKVDRLMGLKENVIIGKLIPAGTGLAQYNQIGVKKEEKKPETEVI
jgi:DNA-directed RNA polymerase subunit beta'